MDILKKMFEFIFEGEFVRMRFGAFLIEILKCLFEFLLIVIVHGEYKLQRD